MIIDIRGIERVGFILFLSISLLFLSIDNNQELLMDVIALLAGWGLFIMNMRVYGLIIPFILKNKSRQKLVIPVFFIKYISIIIYLYLLLLRLQLPHLPFLMGALIFYIGFAIVTIYNLTLLNLRKR